MTIFFYTPNPISEALSLNDEVDLLTQTRGLECWINITFFYLKNSKIPFEIKLVNEIPVEGLILFHKGYFPKDFRPNSKQYFICIQADYGRHRYAQMHIVQNPYQSFNLFVNNRLLSDYLFSYTSTDFIPLWPQPCLIPRDLSRKYSIQNVNFFGNPQETLPGLNIEMNSFFEKRKLNFIPKYNIYQWHDYQATDIVLSIRSFSKKEFYHKPLSKLVNGVLAGSIIIAGDESSATYFKKHFYPELLTISNISELQRSIDYIINNSESSFQAISKAKNRIAPFLKDALVNKWVQSLCKAIDQYNRWLRTSQLNRDAFYNFRNL